MGSVKLKFILISHFIANISFSCAPWLTYSSSFFANILLAIFGANFSSTRPNYIYWKTRTRGVLRTLKIERFPKIVIRCLFKSNISKKSYFKFFQISPKNLVFYSLLICIFWIDFDEITFRKKFANLFLELCKITTGFQSKSFLLTMFIRKLRCWQLNYQ